MRIIFLAHRLPYPPNKGERIRAFWELKALAQNHEVDLFCFCDDPKDARYAREMRGICHSVYVEPISVVGSRVGALRSFIQQEPFSTGFFYSATMARRVTAAIHARSYDLIFVFSSSMAQYVETWPHLPRILDLVDVDSDKWVQYANRSRGFISWLWKGEGRRLAQYESHLVKSFCNTLVCTNAEARLLRSIAATGNITILPNWLDTDFFRPESVTVPSEIKALQPYVVFTGSMDYFPNVDAVRFFAAKVLPDLLEQVPKLQFVIAGRNPSAEVKQLGKSRAIHVTGAVHDIRPYLCGAAIAVAPMRIARGVQNKILEALAMGLPVIASSAAASGLPQDLVSLVTIADEPARVQACLLRHLRESQQRFAARRRSVVAYTKALELSGQREGLLRAAAENVGTHGRVSEESLASEIRRDMQVGIGA